jgi:hypothetical protein
MVCVYLRGWCVSTMNNQGIQHSRSSVARSLLAEAAAIALVPYEEEEPPAPAPTLPPSSTPTAVVVAAANPAPSQLAALAAAALKSGRAAFENFSSKSISK